MLNININNLCDRRNTLREPGKSRRRKDNKIKRGNNLETLVREEGRNRRLRKTTTETETVANVTPDDRVAKRIRTALCNLTLV